MSVPNATATPAPEAASDAASDGSLQAIAREFAATDPRSLGLFRIVFGVFLLIDLARRVPDLGFFYTNEGMLPNHGALFRPMSGHLFSIFHAFSTRGEVAGAFAATAIVYALYTVGFHTRLMQVLVLVLVTSLHSRNILLENGGDVICNILALWTCFLPLGRRFSVDALRESLTEREEGTARHLNDRASPVPDRRAIISLAFAAVVLNLVVVYFFNVVHKDGAPWKAGTAVHYVFWADRLVEPMGVWMRSWVPSVLVKAMTLGTLVIESSIVALLLSPVWMRSCRRVASLLILALHGGFQIAGHFGLFSFVMMLHAILLLGPEDWDALARRMRGKLPKRIVFYDPSCGICHQLCRLAKRLDHLGNLTFVGNLDEAQLPPGITRDIVARTVVVSNADKTRVWLENDAVIAGLEAVPYGVVLSRLGELPGLHALGGVLYRAVASRRVALSIAFGYAACGVEQHFGDGVIRPPRRSRPALFGRMGPLLATLVTLVFVAGLGSQAIAENRKATLMLPPAVPFRLPKFHQPPVLGAVAQYGRFFQGWSMFAPTPPNDDGVVVVDGVTADGRHIDPLTGGMPVHFALPSASEGNLMTQFWYEFHDRIRRENNAGYRGHFQVWLEHWHTIERRPAADRLVAFEVFWVSRPTQAPGSRVRLPQQQQKLMEWRMSGGPPPSPTPSVRVPLAN